MKNFKSFLVALISFFYLSCMDSKKENNLKEIAKIPKELKEISGIIYNLNSFWALSDSGNGNIIYQLNDKGIIMHSIMIENLKNNDWEDITKDEKGNLFIGDFGNNNNTRKDLGIYKINVNSLSLKKTTTIQTTTFYYPEQQAFPPKKKELLFDCEGFFELDGFFYLFTKNRSKGFDGTTLLYKIPNQEGHFKAELISKYTTCEAYNFCAITSVSISPDKRLIALLSHDKVWLLENNNGKFSSTLKAIELNHNSQKESICFEDNSTLIIADEKVKKKGGKLYQFRLSLKTKS